MSRISYRNYPILEMLNNGSIHGVFKCYTEDIEELKIKSPVFCKLFEDNAKGFSENITRLSDNFGLAALENCDKLIECFKEEINESNINLSGVMIFRQWITLYRISTINGVVNIIAFEVMKDGLIINVIEDENNIFNSVNNMSKITKEYPKRVLNFLITILYFKKYASVEVIESKAKSKTKQFGCKYLNETDLDIEYLDSKWFTTLVNSKGFKVRGFLRLQPKKKDGKWTKELIWIDEFKKKGYNRLAKVLNKDIDFFNDVN